MATWEKIKFFWKTMLGSAGSTLTATSTESTGDYDVDYLHNWLETNMWKPSSADVTDNGQVMVTYDAGAGNTKEADYLAVIGHNLNTAGATIGLQYSSDGTTYYNAYTAEAVSADTVYLKEFASPGAYRYWRFVVSGLVSTVPYMTICVWGLKTELDYASASFDPHGQETKANVNITQGGYVSGIHTHYIERRMSLRFSDADTELYDKIKDWWEAHGIKNLFIAWERANNPTDVFLMRPGPRFQNPLVRGGLRRGITIDLTGRKE